MSGRPERPSKRVRRLSTDSEGTEDTYDWVEHRGQSGRAEQATLNKNQPSRSRRTASGNVSVATVSRGPPTAASRSPESMRLTVKTSSSKLREATRVNAQEGSAANQNKRDPFIGGQIIEGKRARNVRKSYVLESDSEDEEEEEDEEMEDVSDEDAEAEIGEDEDEDMDAEDDGLGDEDADGEMDIDVPPPPPIIKISRASNGKQTISFKPAGKSDGKTVEQKEVEAATDDEELSELESEVGEEVEEEEGMQTGNEEDAEGEEEEIEEDVEEDDEDDLDSDDDTPGGGSRASTPDINKLTKRQRARLEEGGSGHLLALPDEVQVKKHLTAEEHAMRRAEMARRRKNLSEKRNEEEKMETINKLLKKQAPKTNARRNLLNAVGGGDATPDIEAQKPNPLFVRWISRKEGNFIGVPEEWVEGPVGEMFRNSVKGGADGAGVGADKQAIVGMSGKLIEEVS